MKRLERIEFLDAREIPRNALIFMLYVGALLGSAVMVGFGLALILGIVQVSR